MTSGPMGYTPMTWPNQQYEPGGTDPPFVGVFYANINYRTTAQYDPSQISWRVLDPATSTDTAKIDIMSGMLEQISIDVRGAVVGAQFFGATWGVVVTYYNTTYMTTSTSSCNANSNDWLADTCLVSGRESSRVELVSVIQNQICTARPQDPSKIFEENQLTD